MTTEDPMAKVNYPMRYVAPTQCGADDHPAILAALKLFDGVIIHGPLPKEFSLFDQEILENCVPVDPRELQ